MTSFITLKYELECYLSDEQIDEIQQAYQFAADAHEGQQRHSGEPFITHPLAVAIILAQMRMDTATIMAALLHDVIEDTHVKKITLKTVFSPEIAELVDGVSKLFHITFENHVEAQAENFRKMLLAMARDIRVIIIKLADRLHNMRTLKQVPNTKRRRIARETLDIYAPIAQRLSMRNIQAELEELSFANLYPLRYRVLQNATQKIRQKRMGLIKQIEITVKECLKKRLLYSSSLIFYKPKHLYPIYQSMRKNRLSFNENLDLPNFCIAVDSIDTCYRVLGAIHTLYKPILEHFKDYIALPKANGYQALHTTLFAHPSIVIQFQIKTLEMENRAHHGIVSHWLTHSSQSTEPAYERAHDWLRHLLDIQKITPSALEFIQSVKHDLFPSGIYLFTPKGDIIELPASATPIDFAYAIHSDIGNHCISAHVDRRLVPLNTQLITGQMVEISTDLASKPDPNWLEFIVTGRARSHIYHHLKHQKQSAAVALGQHLLNNLLTTFYTDWTHDADPNIATVLANFGYSSEEQLLEAIGLGNVIAHDIARSLLKQDIPTYQQPLLIQGSDALILLAECCKPIPDDEIVGALRAGHGIEVHVYRCKHAIRNLKRHPEKFVPVAWQENVQGCFKVDLRIETFNKIGVLSQITNQISKIYANIENVKMEHQGKECGILYLTLSIHNRKHLAKVLRPLRNLISVLKISRGK